MKIRLVGADFHADEQRDRHAQTHGRTDMMKLTVVFRNFANAHKNFTFCPFMGFVWISEQTVVISLNTLTDSFL
jgi:hypothetical protein